MTRNLYSLFIFLFLVVILGWFASPAQAENITIEITAEVETVDDRLDLLAGHVQAGDIITGSYTYESTTPDTNPLPTVGDYWHDMAPYGIHLTVGPWVFETDSSNVDFLIEIVNDHNGRDNYLLRSYKNVAIPELMSGAIVEHISWQLDDPTTTALDSIALPTSPPVLGDWESIFGLSIRGCMVDEFGFCSFFDEFFIRAHVTSATLKVETVEAVVDLRPDTLNRKSAGKRMTAYIELPDGASIENIDTGTIAISAINDEILEFPLFADGPIEIGDYDHDTIPDLMVKFNRQALISLLDQGSVKLTLSAELLDGTAIEGWDTIRVIE